jgi:hypothetical protein
VGDGFEQFVDNDFDAQFFEEFAVKALFERFARLAFASREFPSAAEMGLKGTLGDQELAASKDDPSGYLDVGPRGFHDYLPMLL